MNKIILSFSAFLAAFILPISSLAGVDPSNSLKLGNGTASNKQIIMNRGGSNPQLRWNESTSSMQFSNDGTNFTDIGTGSSAGFNIITTNPDFEQGTNGWTNNAGTFTTVNSGSNLLFGRQSATFVSGGAAQFVESTLYTVPNGLSGRACIGRIFYKGADSNLQLQVIDNSSNVVSSTTLTASTITQSVFTSFLCPSSGSLKLRVNGTASSALIAFDRAYIGENDGLTQVSQASFLGEINSPVTASCTWSTTSAAYASFAAVGACPSTTVTGAAVDPGTKIPAVKFTQIPPGEYIVVATGHYIPASPAVSASQSFTISDGTTLSGNVSTSALNGGVQNLTEGSNIVGHFSYSVTQSNITFQIQAKTNALTNAATIDNATATSSGAFHISVFRFPNSQQLASQSDALPAHWSGYYSNGCSWPRTNTAYGDPTASATCNLVQRVNQNFGTVTPYNGAVTPLPGIVFTPNKAGNYYVCAIVKAAGSNPNTADMRLWDGTTVIAEDQKQLSNANITSYDLCGLYTATSVSPVTLSVQTKQTAGTVTINVANTNTSAIEWSVVQVSQTFPGPVFIGSVTSNTSGTEHIERVTVASNCSSSPCTIASQSGSWITSITRASTGSYNVNFAGNEFSAAPTCTANCFNNANIRYSTVNQPTTAGFQLFCSSDNATLVDLGFQIICMGPR